MRAGLLWMALAGALAPLAHAQQTPTEEAASARDVVLGSWQVVMSEEDQHMREALALAFAEDVPTDEQIEAAELSPEAMVVAGLIVGLRRADPEDPALAQYRDSMAALGGGTLDVSDSAMTLTIGGVSDTQTYVIERERRSSLGVRVTASDGNQYDATLRLSRDRTGLLYEEAGRDGQVMQFRR